MIIRKLIEQFKHNRTELKKLLKIINRKREVQLTWNLKNLYFMTLILNLLNPKKSTSQIIIQAPNQIVLFRDHSLKHLDKSYKE